MQQFLLEFCLWTVLWAVKQWGLWLRLGQNLNCGCWLLSKQSPPSLQMAAELSESYWSCSSSQWKAVAASQALCHPAETVDHFLLQGTNWMGSEVNLNGEIRSHPLSPPAGSGCCNCLYCGSTWGSQTRTPLCEAVRGNKGMSPGPERSQHWRVWHK